MLRQPGADARKTGLAVHGKLRGRGRRDIARHFGPDWPVRPRQRTEPPYFVPLYDAGSAVGNGRQGSRGAHDALPRPAGRIVGQRGRGADVGMVRPLVAGNVRGRACGRTLLVRIAALRPGRSEGPGRRVHDHGREQLRCEQIYPAGVAQWPTLHKALDRSCRPDEGRGAALRDGGRREGVVLSGRAGGVRRPAARGGAAAF